MLIDGTTLRGIGAGRISLAFRRWERPTVKAGGTLLTAIGQLGILSVDRVELDELRPVDARSAGFDDLDALRSFLRERSEGHIYRIGLELAGPDPRIALRASVPGGADLEEILQKLRRWSWAPGALREIRDRPAVRAADLASRSSMETKRFKANVRKLKALGLTESLEVGYRLSPRGEAVLEHLETASD
jgi:hypothetical protein